MFHAPSEYEGETRYNERGSEATQDGKAVAAGRASTGIVGSLLPKRIITARAVKGKRGNNMATPEWKPNKSYKLGDRVTIRYKGQAFLLLCMEPGWSGLRSPTILRGGSKAPGREYETAVVRVHDGTCVWKWKIV